ncbi:hypothetical protein M758_9G160200 [Ceratodon purpureus]|nr:hypothetical protein M758_9G160200 [Ceratodon purpureus]
MGVNDVSEAVVEVAWAALNTQQEAELKELLAVEVIENDKLRRSLKVYEKVIEDLELADAVAAARIEDSSSDSASTASCQEPRTPDMYDKLRDKLSSPEFLQQLASNEGEKPVDPSVMRGGARYCGWCCLLRGSLHLFSSPKQGTAQVPEKLQSLASVRSAFSQEN